MGAGQKLDGARVMLVFPEWPNAPWYPIAREIELRSFLVTSPCYLSPRMYLRPKPRWKRTLKHTDRDRGWRSSNISSTPNAGYPTPGETGTLQPPDSDSTDPQLQRSHTRSPRSQPTHSNNPRALSTHRRNLSFREPPVAPEGNRLPRHTQN